MKNVILIISDTYRWDNLGDRASLPVRTPELDRFAAERATSIERFYTGSFPTIPHRTDLATGRLGWPHYGWQPIQNSSANRIAAIFRECGYVTQLICDCPHLFKSGFQLDFDAAYQHRGQEGDKFLLHLNDPIEEAMPPGKTRYLPQFHGKRLVDIHRWVNRDYRCEEDTFPPRTAATAARWLEENYKAGPFFLWVDFFDPHEPWDAPEYMVRRYDPDYSGPPMLHPNYGPSSDYTPEELRNLRAHYAAEAEIVDRWIGRVLQKIDDLALWDESIVVMTSDHGFSIGEHARTGKSNIHPTDERFWPIYPEIGHVPFLVAGGDVPRGKSLDAFAQPIDILPTLCELAGAKPNPPEPFQGKSFAGTVLAGEGRHREYAVSGCCVSSEGEAIPPKAVTPFVVTDKWGYAPLGANGSAELYDIAKDPLAADDVAAENPEALKELHELFLAHLREYGAADEVIEMWRNTGHRAHGSWAVDYPDKTV